MNGTVVREPGTKVDPGADTVEVDGREVVLEEPVWIAVNKPSGYVTTREDPEGRRTVYDLLPEELHHLFHVGRLDRASQGLLLLTNDGETANRLLHPRYRTTKEYLVEVEGDPDMAAIERLVEGVELEDGVAYATSVWQAPKGPSGNARLRVELEEGRNREVRRMMDAIGHPVVRLVRRRFGPIELGKLPRGMWRYLTFDELRSLRTGA